MTRTRRIYNNPDSPLFYHPWRSCCMGHCPRCKEWRLRSRRRAAWKAEVRQRAITDRYWADLEGFEYFDPLAGLVDIYYEYVDGLNQAYLDDW